MRWTDWIIELFQPSVRTLRRRLLMQLLEDRAVPSAGAPGVQPVAMPQTPFPVASGTLWRDLNADGVEDAKEPGIPFVTLQLFQGNTLVGTTSTDYLGNYQFNHWNVNNGTADTSDDGLQPNTAYEIRIAGSQPALANLAPTVASPNQTNGSDITTGPAGAVLDFTTTTSDVYPNLNGGYAKTGTIGDLIWLDTNNNGKKDANEPGIANLTVDLMDSTGTTVLATTTTDAKGAYSFTGLMPGSYIVEIAASNFAVGGPLYGSTPSTGKPGQVTITGVPDPNVATTTGMNHGFDVAGGGVQSLAVNVGTNAGGSSADDFGFFRSSGLSGQVFIDVNGNGRIDQEDTTGLADVQIRAAGPAGVFTATTDANGNYQMSNLPAGMYTVTMNLQPAGYKGSTPNLVSTTLPIAGTATVNFGEARAVDLKLTQTVSRSVVGKNRMVDLTYKIQNLGTLAATGVTLNATLPPSLKFVSAIAGGALYNAATQSAAIGTLAAGAEIDITIRIQVLRIGSYSLRATVMGDEPEDNLANNLAVAHISPPVSTSAVAVGPNWLLGSAH
jgi:uncharacterized repeat protein (TIGR01451 family)